MLRERPTTLLVAALSALAIAAVVALRAARRRRIPTPEADAPTVPVEPPPGPDAVALARLAELRARDVRTAAESLAFHVDAAVALREYVHGRFAVRTTERTTEEVVAALAAVPARDRAGAEGAFAACDLVKFAAHAASPAERNALLDAAARFVRTTSPPAHRGSADA